MLEWSELMIKIYEFSDLLNFFIAENELNFLLGNGFSISLDERFKSTSILSSLIQRDQKLNDFFNKFETTNIEKIMESIEITKDVLFILGESKYFDHVKYIDKIKDVFINTISSIHPKALNDDEKIRRIRSVFREIDNIFTTNYDLLLYWIVMELRRKDNKEFNDGFDRETGPLLWQKKSEQNLFYLRGALHMHSLESGEILKNAYDPPFDTLIKILKKNLNAGQWPMIVLEGTSKQKITAIERSRYLNNALSKLKDISGAIFVHGFSFNDNDTHIYDAIFNNKNLEQICISASKEDSENMINRINKISRNKAGEKKILFYDRDSI